MSSSNQQANASAEAISILALQGAYKPDSDPLLNVIHPSKSFQNAGLELIRGDRSWHDKGVTDTPVNLSYSFWEQAPANMSSMAISGFSSFNQQQREQAKLSLQSWSDVANITFTETSNTQNANIKFGLFDVSSRGSYAFAYNPDSSASVAGQTWYNATSNVFANNLIHENEYGRQTLTHEIGHALGLQHPGDYNAAPGVSITYNQDATYFEDSRAHSVMSYFSESSTGQDFQGAYSSAPLLNDITAIQHFYGANMTTRSGDTTYGFNSNTDRDFLTATGAQDKIVFSAWDAGGTDTFDFSGFSQNQRINLNEQSFSDVGGLKGNVSIAAGVTIENAFGGAGNDVIIGNNTNNILMGGAGDDILYGGGESDHLFGNEGKDTFVYFAANESRADAPDWIVDFVSGEDKIDLSLFNTGGSKGIEFVSQFSGKAGEAMLSYDVQTQVSDLTINLGGGFDASDFLVKVVGQPLETSDFVLA
ncbi:serralysin family metalloprotease [Serratia proteamaculans]|uniref:serralysin family metalloprotease n=1 Tax=Serratia proteamaculans TaxID=28151 RepID=UPI00124A5ADA|nr:serralysin family metalloprotease [Serratia proteamaculans]KAB1498206.1 matrixin family metalloprotease [Serratia proteamaculans]CAI0727030.1 Serralysin [Serratia proteamaculans]CAI0841063.1 Serralysin [Serratia proteamaculans]CAI0841646.1 Serralysin [Serratia proteamaculans]CAI2073621.1 Serralysin [Serratia proteamaculans]